MTNEDILINHDGSPYLWSTCGLQSHQADLLASPWHHARRCLAQGWQTSCDGTAVNNGHDYITSWQLCKIVIIIQYIIAINNWWCYFISKRYLMHGLCVYSSSIWLLWTTIIICTHHEGRKDQDGPNGNHSNSNEVVTIVHGLWDADGWGWVRGNGHSCWCVANSLQTLSGWLKCHIFTP